MSKTPGEFVVDPRTGGLTRLWSEAREWQWLNSAELDQKRSYVYKSPIPTASGYIVDFLGFDPRVDSDPSVFHFTSDKMNALDIMEMNFDFSKKPSDTLLTTASNHRGQCILAISSDQLTAPSTVYQLPFDISNGGGHKNYKFQFKLLAIKSNVNGNISISLFDSSHFTDLHFFNNAVSINLRSPFRSNWGTPNAFMAIISSSLLNSGQYELPYNMNPTLARRLGPD